MLASAVALIMVGLTGMWLWFDATADARQDLPGVVVTVDDVPAEAGVVQPADDAAPADGQQAADATDGPSREQADREAVTTHMASVDGLMAFLRAARGDLTQMSDDVLAQAAKEKAEKEKKEKEEAKAAASNSGSGSSGSSGSGGGYVPPAAPAPQPVNPAPVTPPGMCWDDDEWEECDDDDWDDDWDDDDWDDD